MAQYLVDVPAYVTLRIEADNEAHAAKIVRESVGLMFHDFGSRHCADHYVETEVPGVEISDALTIYGDIGEKRGDWTCSEPEAVEL